MAARVCLTMACLVLTVRMASGAPGLVERRSLRDLDKVYDLRARLQQLQKQIHELEAEEDSQEATGNDIKTENDDVSSENHDVIEGHNAGKESQMTMTRRQKHMQMLEKDLNDGSQNDMHELAETLRQLLRSTLPGPGGAEETHSAGEYLSDKYNGHSEQRAKKYNNNRVKDLEEDESEEEEEEEEQEEEEDEDEKKELESIHNMLLGLSNGRQSEEEHVKPVASSFDRLPSSRSSPRYAAHGFQTERGTFGDFVETDENSRPSAPLKPAYEMRKSVLSAIEKRLQENIRDAESVGISIDDLIKDVRDKAIEARSVKLRQIEDELTKLSEREE